jgi:hypothetical protein
MGGIPEMLDLAVVVVIEPIAIGRFRVYAPS